jgi:hypothetical protein
MIADEELERFRLDDDGCTRFEHPTMFPDEHGDQPASCSLTDAEILFGMNIARRIAAGEA